MRRFSVWRHVGALAIGVLLTMAAPAVAQDAPSTPAAAPAAVDPEKLALAERLYSSMHLERTLRGMMANMFRGVAGGSGDDPRARQMMSSLSVGFDAALPGMIHAMVEVYARELTLTELRDAAAFYDSPSGQAILTKMPAMMNQFLPAALKMLPTMAAVTEQDYCSHIACTEADHATFARMKGAGAPRPAPAGG
jgi:hypothetical protein